MFQSIIRSSSSALHYNFKRKIRTSVQKTEENYTDFINERKGKTSKLSGETTSPTNKLSEIFPARFRFKEIACV